ncbi:DUF6110 family protein [Aerococcus urinaehominis]|uniref:DUF6110 family protein n=1 Tax=Aerococcus urinaehominis TaxID=128944 RepID=UPI00130E4F10|nr:DUF6110 family protein [Aerococcus urinaehominis]
MKKFAKRNKGTGIFAAGALAATAGVKLLTSKTAKQAYSTVIAKGMHAVDEVNQVISSAKQQAEDVYEDAKDIYAADKQAEAQELVVVEPTTDSAPAADATSREVD